MITDTIKVKYSLAFISSPGQYYNLLEYVYQSKIDLSTINLYYFGYNHELLIVDKYFSWNNFRKRHFIKYSKNSLISKITWWIKLIFIFLRILFSKNSTFISGQIWSNYHLIFSILFKNKEIISLDEGNANILAFRQSKYLRYFSKKIHHFTALNLNFPKLINNNYVLLNSFNENKTSEQIIYIFGSPYVYDNMMDIKTYKMYLDLLSNYYKDYKICYLPHRREFGGNYFSVFPENFQIIEIIGCFELWFLNQKVIPELTVNFGSGITSSLKNIFKHKSKINILDLYKNDFYRLNDFYEYLEIIDEYKTHVNILKLR